MKNRNLLKSIALLLVLMFAVALIAGCDDDGANGTGQDQQTAIDDPNVPQGGQGGQEVLFDGSANMLTTPTRPIGFTPHAPSFTTNDPNIVMIEVNQGLSYGFDTASGEFYVMENFVAGKETAVFVAFAEPVAWFDEAWLMIENNGAVVAQLLPVDMADEHTMLFQPRNMGDVGNWEAGAYTFTFHMDGSEAVRTTNLYESKNMKVLLVPILANYGGYIVGCEGAWRNGGTMLAATFPIGRDNLEIVLAPELDLTASRYDLTSDEGTWYVWDALNNLQTPNNDYTIISGFIADRVDMPGGGQMMGWTFGAPSIISVESDPDMWATVVHEAAHIYRIGDEYDGGSMNPGFNMPPYQMEGRVIFTSDPAVGTHPSVASAMHYGIQGDGSVIYPVQRAYWVEGRQLMGKTASYMGSGWDAYWDVMWTTSDIWNQLFMTFVGHVTMPLGGVGGTVAAAPEGAVPGGGTQGDIVGQCPECFSGIPEDADIFVFCWDTFEFVPLTQDNFGDYDESDYFIECRVSGCLIWIEEFRAHNSGETMAGRRAGRESAPVMVVEITGYLDTASGMFIADPWYTFEADVSDVTSARSGDYSVVVYDGAGSQVSVSNFSLVDQAQMRTTAGTVPSRLGRVPVEVIARFPQNSARIAIYSGEQEIYSRDVSNNAPTVAFTGLTDYQALPDRVTLTWEAHDADGDELFFDLWYVPSEHEFFNIASNITGRSFEVDLSAYPGTYGGFFYIFATDGVLTSEIDSPWVVVEYKAPEIFTTQDGIPEVKVTEEIFFDVDIYDLQDGWLWDSYDVKWMLGGQEFMTGSTLWVWPYELAPGTHTFTVVATNSAGMSAQAEFTFRILDDESDLPDDWSREDIIDALSNGFVLPLDRIDAPVTRSQFARLMFTLYATVAEDYTEWPEYEEGVITDSGQDVYNEFLMVWLGVMDAPGGRFDPTQPVTEREAAIIMYQVMALSDPYWLDFLDNEADILDIYIDAGVIDDSGPNSYRPDERLTNRLALVRLGRLYIAIFGE